MPTTQQLTEQRNSVWSQMTEVIEAAEREGRDLSAEERANYDAAERDLDRLSDDIARQERHEARSRQMTTVESDRIVVPAGPDARSDEERDAEYRGVFNQYLRFGMAELEPEQRQILRRGFSPDTETRAQSVGTNSAGGYLVPAGYRNRIVETMKDYGKVMEVAEVITTDSGQPLPWPTNNDTGNVGALLAENTQISEQDLTIGTAQLDAYKYTSKLTRVSLELIQDAAFDIENFIVRKHGERLGRITNQHLTTGTGSSQPNGIVTGATSGVTAAGTAAITADELISLIHSVDPAYRNANSKFMMSDTAFAALRKLKDGNSNYLFQPAAAAGAPDTLFGYPVIINQDMAVPATGVKSVLFGDFRAGYVVRLVRAMQVVRFEERYMDYFQLAFTTFSRLDGEVQDSGAYKALTQA